MKRKIIAMLLTGSLTLTLACGCGGSKSIIIPDRETDGASLRTVTFFGHRTDASSLNVIESVLQGFMSENGDVNVSYESATQTSYLAALERRFKTNNLDDVFMTDRDMLLTLGEYNALADISTCVNTSILSDFALSQSSFGADGKKLYSVPTAISTYGLFINYDLLQKNGVSVPKNYREFAAACDYFAQNGVTPLIVNNYCSINSLISAVGLYDIYQGTDVSSELENFNSIPTALCDKLNDGVDFVYGLIENGWIDINEAKACTYLSGDIQLFTQGERPFMVTGSYAATSINKILKDNGASLSFGIHPFPVLETGSVLVAQADAMLCVKNGENTKDAENLIKTLTSYRTLESLTEGLGAFTVLKGQTQIYCDAALIPSASYLTSGKYVIASDINLKLPLDTYLLKCGGEILDGTSAETVKSHLYGLLDGKEAE